MIISEDMKVSYQQDGFLLLKNAIDVETTDFSSRLNGAIKAMAESICTPEKSYLQAVCRWDSPCKIVQEFTHELSPDLEPMVAATLNRNVEIVRASVIRKSFSAARPTHGHQDAGYWLENASNTYDLSTWVALEDINASNGALRIVPGSHKGGL